KADYLWYCLQAMTPEFERLRFGSTHQTIYMPDVAQFKVPVPPLSEQERIANFLDEQTARIDALIAEKERLIAKLVDLREAEVCYRLIPGLFVGITHQDNIDGWSLKLPAEWKVKA